MEKDCVLYFSDDTAPYPFNSADIAKALSTAFERKWPISAIKTPHYTLSVFTHEEYAKAISVFSESEFHNVGV